MTDSWLAEKLIEKNNPKTLEKMIYITDHLADFTIDTAIKYLDIQDALKKPNRNIQKCNRLENK